MLDVSSGRGTQAIYYARQFGVDEMFWKVRIDRDVSGPGAVLTLGEKARTAVRVARRYGIAGIRRSFENERAFYRAVLDGKLGYALYWGRRPAA